MQIQQLTEDYQNIRAQQQQIIQNCTNLQDEIVACKNLQNALEKLQERELIIKNRYTHVAIKIITNRNTLPDGVKDLLLHNITTSYPNYKIEINKEVVTIIVQNHSWNIKWTEIEEYIKKETTK